MRISDWSSDVCSSDLPRVGPDLQLAGWSASDRVLPQVVTQARLVAEGEGGAHLHAGGAHGEGFPHLDRIGVAAGQPERQTGRPPLVEVDLATGAVDRPAPLAELHLAPRWALVAPSGRPPANHPPGRGERKGG